MAEFIKVPVSSLIKLPDGMSSSIGALIEPLAVAVHGVGRISLASVEVAVVLGAGPIGLLTGLVLQARKVPHVIISDVLHTRIELARSLGLEGVVAGSKVLDRVMKVTHGNGADAVFECAGHPSSAREMTALVRSRATIVNLGVFKKPVELDMQTVNFRELEIIGSRVYERKDFSEAIQLAGLLPLERVISAAFPISDVSIAFEQFQSNNACKVLILPRG
jgi:threonine dehydrogenase-like Zn-dependent dehydrogenase